MNETPSLGFAAAVSSALRRSFDYGSRSRRSEYWWFALFGVVVSLLAGAVDRQFLHVDPTNDFGVTMVLDILMFFPSLALGIRRLHDTNHTGWWVLLNLVPVIGTLILIVAFYVKDGDPGTNRFGPSPKGGPALGGQGYSTPPTYPGS